MVTDTLPCPLCGAPPLEGQSYYAYRVTCADCYDGPGSLQGKSYKSLESARRVWNEAVLDYDADHDDVHYNYRERMYDAADAYMDRIKDDDLPHNRAAREAADREYDLD